MTATDQPALVHDYLLVLRGAERTFAAIAECWPRAPVFTLLYDPVGTDDRFADREVHPSRLQRIGIRQHAFRSLLPLYPAAVERLAVQAHSLVVSSSSAFAHGVRPGPEAVHVCYCHTPFRYAWHERDRALAEVPYVARPLLAALLARQRAWDVRASARVTHYVANSQVVRDRINETYGRDAAVVHPPVEIERFTLAEPEDYLLVVSELVPHKRVESALVAAKRANRRIKVVGEGPELPRLRALHGSDAEFVGRVSDEALSRLYSGALALVVPNVEEFGIAAVEAQAAGRPVVAMDAGGTRETVLDGDTGVLVPPNSDESALAEALTTDFSQFAPSRARENAARFSTATFKKRLFREIEMAVGRSA